jgi:predicted transcriptional regulator
MTSGEKRRTIRVSDELWAALNQQAGARGYTASDVVRRLIEEWVAGDPVIHDHPLREGKVAAGAALMAAGIPDDRLDDAWELLRRNDLPGTLVELAEQVRRVAERLDDV